MAVAWYGCQLEIDHRIFLGKAIVMSRIMETPALVGTSAAPACQFTVVTDRARMCSAPATWRIARVIGGTVQRIFVDSRHLPAQLDRVFADMAPGSELVEVTTVTPVQVAPTWPSLPPAVEGGCQWYTPQGVKCGTRAKYLVTAHAPGDYVEAGACGNHLAKQVLRMLTPDRDVAEVALITTE